MNELAERGATGHIATIDDEIRRFCAVPYVSSMHRQIPALPALVAYRKTSPEMVVFSRLIRDALPA